MKRKKKKEHKYAVRISWSPADGAYVAEVPELVGCATHGASFEEAARNAEDAIESWMMGAKAAGNPIPEPIATKKYSGKFIARIQPQIHRALAIKAENNGKSLNRLVEEILERAVS